MSRYIDADWIIQKLERWRGHLAETYGENDEYVLCLGEVLMKLDDAPTADVRENVRGEWIDTTSGEHYKCSQCGTRAPIWIDESNSCEYDKDITEWLSDFCPNCGADMRPYDEP